MANAIRLVVDVGIESGFTGSSEFIPPPVTAHTGFAPYWIQDAADLTNKYNAISGNNFWTPTLSAVQTRWPIASTITKWAVNLPSALPGGASMTLALNKNGVTTGFTITIGAGQSAAVATGSLSVAADDLLAQELTAISGVSSKTVAGGALGFTS